MNSTARFWDRIAKRYSKNPVPDEAVYRKKLEITREYFRPDMDVFEFGCGTGSTAIAHAPYVKHIQAIDFSPKMLEIARGKADAENIANISFTCSAIDDFDAPDGSYDVALGLSILHLVADRDKVIAQIRRMLKPGGIFVTSTICLGDSMRFFRYIGPVGQFLGLLPLIRVFTAKELERSLIEGGFDIDYRWQPGKNKALFIVARKGGGFSG